MATGILGGTFNPVHMGHLRVAEEIREAFDLETVYFIPAFIPPHKESGDAPPPEERLRMLRAATRGSGCFKVSDLEIKRGGISYTIDTLKRFELRFDDLYFIIGADAFRLIGTWHRYEELFSHAHFIVMTRPASGAVDIPDMLPARVRGKLVPFNDAERKGVYIHESGKKIYLYRVTQLDISSTKVRNLLSEGRSVRYLVPPPVERIIIQRRLYRS